MSSNSWIYATCNWLKSSQHDDATEEVLSTVQAASVEQLEQLVEVVSAISAELSQAAGRTRMLFQHVASRALQLSSQSTSEFAPLAPDVLAEAALQLGRIDAMASAHALQILAAQCDEESLTVLASAIAEAPPSDWRAVGLALSPLWNAHENALELFFDRIAGVVVHPASLSVLLDLANYAIDSGKLDVHPWNERSEELIQLLGGVTRRLQLLEKDPAQFGEDVDEIQLALQEGVALVIALSAALGLIGNEAAATQLEQTMQLSHRRIQTEAACSLARLGHASGRERIVALASDSAARATAVRIADELGFADEIDEQLRLPAAVAESELASWLADPAQFGVPPSRLELRDARTQFWPSYDEPRDCFLFRYEYVTAAGTISNIGIAGPVCHAFQSNLCDLPIDDMYAAFAGWHAEHEEIFEIPAGLLSEPQRREANVLAGRLEESGVEITETLALAFFFGEVSLLVRGLAAGTPSFAVVDELEFLAFPASSGQAALTPELILAIFRGRKLLRTFNVNSLT